MNPMENVWAYLRSNKLAIPVFDTYGKSSKMCPNVELLRQRSRTNNFNHQKRLSKAQLLERLVEYGRLGAKTPIPVEDTGRLLA